MNRSSRIAVALTFAFLAGAIFLLVRARRADEEVIARVVEGNQALWQRIEDEREVHEARRAAALRTASLAHVRAARLAFETGRWSELTAHLAAVPEEDRGWVWSYLDLCSKLVVSKAATHEESVTALTSSADGKYLASGSDDGAMIVWSVDSDAKVVEFTESDTVIDLALDVHGSRLACATRAGVVSLWDVVEETLVGELEIEAGCLALARDGSVVVGCEDGRVLRWNGESEGETTEIGRHEDVVNAITFDRYGTAITGSDDWEVHLEGGQVSLDDAQSWITCVAYDAAGPIIAGGTDDGSVHVWRGAQRLFKYEVSETSIRALALANGLLAAVADDGTVMIVELDLDRKAEMFHLPPELAGGLEGAVIAPDLTWVAFAGADESVRVWHRERPVARNRMNASAGRVRSLAASVGGGTILVGGSRGEAVVVDGMIGTKQRSLAGHDELVTAAALTNDGALGITADRTGALRVWSMESGELSRSLEGGAGGWTNALSITNDGTRALSVTRKAITRNWNLLSGEMLRESVGPRAGVFASTAQPGADHSAWIANGGTIRMWEANSGGRQFGVRDRELLRPDSIAISRDGSRILVVAAEISAATYDVPTGKLLARMRDEEGMFQCAAISSDGDVVATGARDGRILLWDTATGEQLLALGEEGELPTAMTFTSDGKRLIVGSGFGRIDVWETELDTFRRWRR